MSALGEVPALTVQVLGRMYLQIRHRSIRQQRAFTLIEVLLVVAILGVVMALAAPAYENQRNRTLVAMAVSDIRQIESTLNNYFVLNAGYPPSLEAIGIDLKDPWGNPYYYVRMSDFDEKGNPLEKGKSGGGGGGGPKPKVRKDRHLHPINTDYDLYSMGADQKSVAPLTAKPSRDDIIRASNGAFLGLADDY